MAKKTSGQEPFRFSLCDDLYTLPERANPQEVDLHGGFADDTDKSGYIYYGMPGCGIMRITADLSSQEIIELPSDLAPINFHSTKIIEFDGKRRLVLPANGDAMVVVVGLDGNVDFKLSRPEFEEYRDEQIDFKPTDTAFANGTLYVSDGYGNSRVHKYDTNGKYIKSWGQSGSLEGQFSLPHNIAMNGTDKVTVADRENFRLQTFTTDGEFVKQIHLHRPMALTDGKGDDKNLYVAEAGPPPVQEGVRRLGRRVVVIDREGSEVTRFGNELSGEDHDQFIAPHGIAVDSEGSVYVAEVSYTAFGSLQDPPREVTSLRKWRRV